MQNELKPCPFCGGKIEAIERDGYAGGEYITEIECNVCHMHVENLYNNDKTIDLWNTRQPAFDWKPIEELTNENQRILLHKKAYDNLKLVDVFTTAEIYGGHVLYDGWLEKYKLKDVKRRYTQYSPLTPPQTNQS